MDYIPRIMPILGVLVFFFAARARKSRRFQEMPPFDKMPLAPPAVALAAFGILTNGPRPPPDALLIICVSVAFCATGVWIVMMVRAFRRESPNRPSES